MRKGQDKLRLCVTLSGNSHVTYLKFRSVNLFVQRLRYIYFCGEEGGRQENTGFMTRIAMSYLDK